MAKELVYSGQNFYDKVIECTGDIDNSFAMFKANGFDTNVRVEKKIKSTVITNWDVVDYFTESNRPATNHTNNYISPTDFLLPGELPYSL